MALRLLLQLLLVLFSVAGCSNQPIDPIDTEVPLRSSGRLALVSNFRLTNIPGGILSITPTYRNSTMQQTCGHRENLPGVLGSSPGGHSENMTSTATFDTQIPTGLRARHPDTSSTFSTLSPSSNSTQKLSTDDKSIESTVTVVHAEKSSTCNDMSARSLAKISADDTFVYDPRKRSSSIEVQLSEASWSSSSNPTKKLSTDNKSIESTVTVVHAEKSSNCKDMSARSLAKASVDDTLVYDPRKRSSSIKVHLSEAGGSLSSNHTQKLSTDDKSVESTVTVVHAEKSSNCKDMSARSLAKASADDIFVYDPRKHSSSIEVHLSEASGSPMTSPLMSVETAEQKGKSVTLGPCPCEQEDCTMSIPHVTTCPTAVDSIGRKGMSTALGPCPCGEDDCMASSSKIITRPTQPYEHDGQNRRGLFSSGWPLGQAKPMDPCTLVGTSTTQSIDLIGQEANAGAFDHCPCGQNNCIIPRPQVTSTPAPDGSFEQKEEAPALENRPSGPDDCTLQCPPATTPKQKSTDLAISIPKDVPDDQKAERPSPLGWYRTTLRNKPVDCDYLKSCQDIRAEPDDDYARWGWSIQEGSLVIGINPAYVVPTEGVQPSDQLELKEGALYVVQQIYGDMWALCLEISTTKPHGGGIPGAPNEVVGLGFVPLCAVTLAANYSTFLERRREYRRNSGTVLLTPSNGARVMPPVRIQSLAVSREIHWQITKGQNNFVSKGAYKICGKFRPIGEDDPAYETKDRMKRLKLLVQNPRRALRNLTAKKMEVKASWVGPDSVPSQPTPCKKLVKGVHRPLNIIGGIKRLCGKICDK
ncbi:hypothetical protein PMG11_01713 [Penicillium brasilianum]|uniref:SH3 domain-containing protein n=1 Tax=Penicillium brasilianum TaxID=104259 RepID=A0A0F7TG31_PENBI|nr:hypothetical protein PMG11_01713 [Penicillium brasilianum]